MSALPKHIVLKSKYNNKYLRFVHEEGKTHKFLQFSGEYAMSPYTKFEVEVTQKSEELVYLRCCYNNKYLILSIEEDESYDWFLAEVDNPEEDQSREPRTLFKPIYVEKGKEMLVVRLMMVSLGERYVTLRTNTNRLKNACLGLEFDNPQVQEFIVIDWDSLVALPRYLAFKGDNASYLKAMENKEVYLQFSGDDMGHPLVGHEVFTRPDGSIRLKSDYSNKFWRRCPNTNWILADGDKNSADDPNTVFWPVKIGDNLIALRSLGGNGTYCKRMTDAYHSNCLCASLNTITKEANLEVHELVVSRNVFGVVFHVSSARIYDKNIIILGCGSATNTTEKDASLDVKIVHAVTKSSIWNSSLALKVGAKATISAGVPFVVDGKVEVSAEITGTIQWGTVHTDTSTFETVYKVVVPPMHKVKVRATGAKATCAVPFSYSQTDTLTSGKLVTSRLEDGYYIGVSSFDFDYEVKTEKLEKVNSISGTK